MFIFQCEAEMNKNIYQIKRITDVQRFTIVKKQKYLHLHRHDIITVIKLNHIFGIKVNCTK